MFVRFKPSNLPSFLLISLLDRFEKQSSNDAMVLALLVCLWGCSLVCLLLGCWLVGWLVVVVS